MRVSTRHSIVLAVALFFGAAVGDAHAFCNSPGSTFTSNYFDAPIGQSALATSGTFWGIGQFDPSHPGGTDNGAWPSTEWLRYIPEAGFYLAGDWAAVDTIDGCIHDAPNPQPALMGAAWTTSDVDDSYFAALCSVEDNDGVFAGFLDIAGSPMTRMPQAVVLSSSHTFNGVVLTVGHEAIGGGVYNTGACALAVTGFKIYQQRVPHNAPGPAGPGSRSPSAGWTLLGQGTTSLDVSGSVDCPAFSDIYLMTTLVLDGNVELRQGSRNSLAIECTPEPCSPSCDDGDACTIDSCSGPSASDCLHTPASCDDGSLCTTDSCNANTGCVYTAIQCDDGSLCTTESCNENTGACVYSAIPCEDGSLCTADSCNVNTGACVHTSIQCDDGILCTTDSCNANTGCVHTAIQCEDGSLCTTGSCNINTGACVHTAIQCDDHDACTTDSCDPSSGCVHGVHPDCSAPAGSLDPTFTQGFSVNGPINAIVVQPDGNLLIGGFFTTIQGTARNGIARLNPDGTVDATFQQGMAGATGVQALALQVDGKVLIGGQFATVNGVSQRRLARLNTDGSLDPTVPGMPNSGGVPYVTSIVVQPDQKILVGAGERPFLLRLNPDGTTDSSFVPPNSPLFHPRVSEVLLQPDGKIVFSGFLGFGSSSIMRLFPTGGMDPSFSASGVQLNQTPGTMVLQSNGKMVFGGSFSVANGSSRDYIARVNADGSLDSTFQQGMSGVGPSGSSTFVGSVALQPDGKLVIGGTFATVNGSNRNNIARLNEDGSLDSSFQEGMSGVGPPPSSYVGCVAIQPDGKILIGGAFTVVNGVAVQNLARLTGCAVRTWFPDSDGDGYGAPSATVQACAQPPDYVAIAGDCDDGDADVHAGAAEACNGVDEDCDGIVDVPAETTGLVWTDKTTLAWTATPQTTGYTVWEGFDLTLKHLLNSSGDSCPVWITEATSTGSVMTTDPFPTEVYWYLVRPWDACGEGSAGNSSSGSRIQNNYCGMAAP